MQKLTLVLGNKNYSSWSLRAWLLVKRVGLPFEEVVIPLDEPNTHSEIVKYSPSGRVPCLMHGDLVVWDSLAIAEYLNETFPQAKLWPEDTRARAAARAVSAEMHSSFVALRQNMPMKIRSELAGQGRTPEVEADIARIINIWTDARKQHASRGPFLFGAYSIADAFFAPVATRFRTYGVALKGEAAEYAKTLRELPEMEEWAAAARQEATIMKRYGN